MPENTERTERIREQIMDALVELTDDPADLESLRVAAGIMEALPKFYAAEHGIHRRFGERAEPDRQRTLLPAEPIRPDELPELPEGWHSLCNMSPADIMNTKPSRIWFPDETEVAASQWNATMVYAIEWLLSRPGAPEIRVPMRNGQRIILESDPEQVRNGNYKRVGDRNLYFATGSTRDMLRDVQHIYRNAKMQPVDYPLVRLR